MADGDKLDHYLAEDTVETTDATSTMLVQIAVPTATDGIFTVDVWAQGAESDGTKWMQHGMSAGSVDGSVSLVAVGGLLAASDPDAKSWLFGVDVNAGNVRLMVTGEAATTIRWHGAMEIHFRELNITGA